MDNKIKVSQFWYIFSWCAICLLAFELIIVIGYFLIIEDASEVNYREEFRVTSPDSTYDAVYATGTGSIPALSISHDVIIVERGGNVQNGDNIFLGNYMEGILLKWEDNQTLEISYRRGEVYKFTNNSSNKRHKIQIKLKTLDKWFLPL